MIVVVYSLLENLFMKQSVNYLNNMLENSLAEL